MRRRFTGLLVVVALAATACSGGGDGDAKGDGERDVAAGSSQEKAGDKADDAKPGKDEIAVAEPESVQGVRIAINELRRTEPTVVTLTVSITNEGVEPADPYELAGDHSIFSNSYLADEAGKQKFLPVEDSQGRCMCSDSQGTDIEPRATARYFAKFPAPPASVTQVTVVLPEFLPIERVPITG